MLIADVNIFLYARRKESERHEEYREWLEDALNGVEPFGVVDQVLASFLRIVTNHRVYKEPTSPRDALAFCDQVRGAPAAVQVGPGESHWEIFSGIVREANLRANLIPDAWLAALSIEAGGTWVTTDAGFGRFARLRWRRPFD
ncbi:MAG TPA: type II toxin-antitoxin system VapC family toxin [Acidimicrobiales bacterium]|nr:type II toxin-antitoxin system VapC family toxin [Acidimicrobiales bacterium]